MLFRSEQAPGVHAVLTHANAPKLKNPVGKKERTDGSGGNQLHGTVAETAYIGVSTQYIVDTTSGPLTVYVQNDRPGANGVAPGDQLTLSWDPESTFVIDPEESY